MVWGPEAMRLNLIWRWEFVITVAGRGGVRISGRAFIALHTLHLVGQFIALHTPQRRFILSPELWRRMAASVGPEAAPHLMELSHPNQTLGFSETHWWNFNKDQNLFFISCVSQNRSYWSLEVNLELLLRFGFISRNLVENSSFALILVPRVMRNDVELLEIRLRVVVLFFFW